MSKPRRTLLVVMFVVWLIAMPLAFATLYSVIELQSAAASAAGNENRLSTLRTSALAARLDAADKAGARRDVLLSERNKAMISLFEARTEVRASAIDLLSKHGQADATKLCTALPTELQACQIDHNMIACTGDWLKITSCYEDALQRSRTVPEDRNDVALLRQQMTDARHKGFIFNGISRRVRESEGIEKDPLLPVAEAYRQIRLPLFSSFFVLPQGVVVACFTSLMAALGAGVASLLNFVRGPQDAQTRDDLARSFVISPLLGGLIGFMVYFVVSAGTAFLVQPAPANPAEATSNLSAPALASLGVLAGLAAEDAVEWLRAKAAAFFK